MEKIAGVFGKPLKNKENDLQGDEDDDDENVSFHGYKEFYTKRERRCKFSRLQRVLQKRKHE